MSKLNLLVYLNAYKDKISSNNPSLNLFKWSREITGLDGNDPKSLEFSLGPGETKVLIDGERVLTNNTLSIFNLELKAGSSNIYRLIHTGGPSPTFRTPRVTGGDATTVINVTKTGNFLTFTSVSGTLFALTPGVQVGDEVVISNVFNALNLGKFKILSRTLTSFTVENPSGVVQTGVVLGATDNIRIFSANGVQKGDKLALGAGFNPIDQNTYEITYVQDNMVEFFSSIILPEEIGVLGPTINIYYDAKKLIYLESDKKVSLKVNNIDESPLEPFIDKNQTYPGIFFKRSTVWALEVTNNTSNMASLFFAAIE